MSGAAWNMISVSSISAYTPLQSANVRVSMEYHSSSFDVRTSFSGQTGNVFVPALDIDCLT
jgi:hypothetical protein